MIEWKKIASDPADIKAEPAKGDMLRVERMAPNVWWYCCYIGGRICEDDINTAPTKKEAKRLCEKLYKKHKNAV